jgi:hypothetical protein
VLIRLSIYITSLLLVFTSLATTAQEEDDTLALDFINTDDVIMPRTRKYYLFSPRVSLTVPHPLGNAAFNKSFVGIYEFNAGLNLYFFRGFYAGATFKNNRLNINQKEIKDYNASMHMNGAAVKVGSDFYMNENNTILLSVSFAAGQNSTKFNSLKCKDGNNTPAITSYKAIYYEPEVDLFLFLEPNFAIGLTTLYSSTNRTFDPYELCLNEWGAYSKTDTSPARYISFGFGFYYGFSTRKN